MICRIQKLLYLTLNVYIYFSPIFSLVFSCIYYCIQCTVFIHLFRLFRAFVRSVKEKASHMVLNWLYNVTSNEPFYYSCCFSWCMEMVMYLHISLPWSHDHLIVIHCHQYLNMPFPVSCHNAEEGVRRRNAFIVVYSRRGNNKKPRKDYFECWLFLSFHVFTEPCTFKTLTNLTWSVAGVPV